MELLTIQYTTIKLSPRLLSKTENVCNDRMTLQNIELHLLSQSY